MEDQKIVLVYRKSLILFLIVFITGCSAATTKISRVQQNFIKSFREPGEKRVSSAEDTLKTYRCRESILYIEHIEVLPHNVLSGKEINQRVRYALCSPKFTKSINGEIVRTILYKNKKQFVDVTKYTFNPGTWNVDVFIEIPNSAEDGEYFLEVKLKYGSETIVKTEQFFVQNKSK